MRLIYLATELEAKIPYIKYRRIFKSMLGLLERNNDDRERNLENARDIITSPRLNKSDSHDLLPLYAPHATFC